MMIADAVVTCIIYKICLIWLIAMITTCTNWSFWLSHQSMENKNPDFCLGRLHTGNACCCLVKTLIKWTHGQRQRLFSVYECTYFLGQQVISLKVMRLSGRFSFRLSKIPWGNFYFRLPKIPCGIESYITLLSRHRIRNSNHIDFLGNGQERNIIFNIYFFHTGRKFA